MVPEVWVLRFSHRVERDKRVTAHVALTSRAFGCRGMYYSGDADPGLHRTVREVNERWGGEFLIQHVPEPLQLVREWKRKGKVIHLTMYGLPLPQVIDEIRRDGLPKLVVVGGEKVPAEFFQLADWNVSITCQPHSEVGALAVFLHELLEGREFGLEFKGARLRVVPQARGKRVEETR